MPHHHVARSFALKSERRGRQDKRGEMKVHQNYKNYLLFFGLAVAVSVGCQGQQPEKDQVSMSDKKQAAPQLQGPKERALAARDALVAKLSGRLTKVMLGEGPAAAIRVCSQEASELASEVSREYGLSIGRTALRLRNPDNAAPEWAVPLMKPSLMEPQFVDLPNEHLGALLPIQLQPKCLGCHGPANQIAKEVQLQIENLYPLDQAMGFQEGDLRGWFWVDVPSKPVTQGPL